MIIFWLSLKLAHRNGFSSEEELGTVCDKQLKLLSMKIDRHAVQHSIEKFQETSLTQRYKSSINLFVLLIHMCVAHRMSCTLTLAIGRAQMSKHSRTQIA